VKELRKQLSGAIERAVAFVAVRRNANSVGTDGGGGGGSSLIYIAQHETKTRHHIAIVIVIVIVTPTLSSIMLAAFYCTVYTGFIFKADFSKDKTRQQETSFRLPRLLRFLQLDSHLRGDLI
jgi:hypothetical protein